MRAAIVVGLVVLATAVAYGKPNKKPKQQPDRPAIVFVIDRSGSMAADKLEAAKGAVLAAIDAADPADRVSLVVFDSEARIVFQDFTRAKRAAIMKALVRIEPGGGTDLFPGLKSAFEILRTTTATWKHVVVLTDGEAPTDGLVELIQDMGSEGISISAVGVAGADRNMLDMIAAAGEGRLYMVEDLGALPKVFVKELRGPRK